MKKIKTISQTTHEQALKAVPLTVWQELSEAESQKIQGGGVLMALLLPAVQQAR